MKLRLLLQLLVKVCNKGASTLTLLDTHVSRGSLPRAACTSPNYMANSCQIDAWVSNPQWENDFEGLHHILQGILQKESRVNLAKVATFATTYQAWSSMCFSFRPSSRQQKSTTSNAKRHWRSQISCCTLHQTWIRKAVKQIERITGLPLQCHCFACHSQSNHSPQNWIARLWFVFQSGSLNVHSCHIVYVPCLCLDVIL